MTRYSPFLFIITIFVISSSLPETSRNKNYLLFKYAKVVKKEKVNYGVEDKSIQKFIFTTESTHVTVKKDNSNIVDQLLYENAEQKNNSERSAKFFSQKYRIPYRSVIRSPVLEGNKNKSVSISSLEESQKTKHLFKSWHPQIAKQPSFKYVTRKPKILHENILFNENMNTINCTNQTYDLANLSREFLDFFFNNPVLKSIMKEVDVPSSSTTLIDNYLKKNTIVKSNSNLSTSKKYLASYNRYKEFRDIENEINYVSDVSDFP